MRHMKKLLALVFVCCLLGTPAFADDFTVTGLKTESQMGMTRVIGRITNNSGTNYDIAIFNLNVFDKSGEFFDVIQIAIQGFRNGQTKTFEGVGMNELPKGCTFELEFDMGS